MSKEDFRNEKLYQTTMHLARKMLEEGIISEEEYRQIDTIVPVNVELLTAVRASEIVDRLTLHLVEMAVPPFVPHIIFGYIVDFRGVKSDV